MTWLAAIALALAAFAVGVFAIGIARSGWTIFAAALALGLTGYALQASPDMPGSPSRQAVETTELGWSLVEARAEMVAGGNRSRNNKVVIADALARRGQFANAAAMLNGAVDDDPRDGEAWLALGNVLVEHADGALTEPAMLAYRRAAELDPQGTGPGYFLGLALIRQGRLMDARGVWAATLEGAAEDAAGRAALRERMGRLDELLTQAEQGGQVPVPGQP